MSSHDILGSLSTIRGCNLSCSGASGGVCGETGWLLQCEKHGAGKQVDSAACSYGCLVHIWVTCRFCYFKLK